MAFSLGQNQKSKPLKINSDSLDTVRVRVRVRKKMSVEILREERQRHEYVAYLDQNKRKIYNEEKKTKTQMKTKRKTKKETHVESGQERENQVSVNHYTTKPPS